MSKVIFSAGIILASLVLMISCSSDNSTNPSDTTNYFPLKQGNFWVYTTTVDDQGTIETTRDSMVIKEQVQEQGKLAFKFENYSDGEDTGETYQYSENEQLFTLVRNLFGNSGGFDLPVDSLVDSWVKIADNKATSWDLYNFDFPEFSFPYNGVDLKVKGNLKITGKKSEKVFLQVMGKETAAQKYTIEFLITAQLTVPSVPLPVNISITIPNHSYYASNIGLVKNHTESVSTTIGGVFPFTTPSSESILVNYSIK